MPQEKLILEKEENCFSGCQGLFRAGPKSQNKSTKMTLNHCPKIFGIVTDPWSEAHDEGISGSLQ